MPTRAARAPTVRPTTRAASPAPVLASRVTAPSAGPARRPAAMPAVRLGTRPAAGRGGGQPLDPAIRPALEESLGADLSAVRVHTDAQAQRVAAGLSARATTYGSDIFLARGARGDDLALIGHEVAHVVQQQAVPAAQRWTALGGDRHEHEAQQASAAVVRGETFAVQGRTTGPGVQRLGIGDALDFFARQANNIPGFRMFTIVLGVNPINMSRVDRSAANVMRAVVEFIPGGGLITQALDHYGVFDRVGNWVDGQLRTLGMTGSAIRQAVMDFVGSLGLSDLFNLGGVWDRAVRIFTAPIRRLIDFVTGLVTGILRFIKDAILMPLARLAEGTRGYDLLKAVLGQDPITGEVVPRTAETLIGGFMKLVGQEEVWENIKRANAIGRAWAWFQGALSGLVGFVRQIPRMFLSALQTLEIADLVLLPRAFARVAAVFGGFIGQFLSWAGQQVMSLLQIIFEVVAPGVMPYIRRAAGAFRTIVQNPIGFIGNLVRAGIQGFRQFAGNFLSHLRTSLIQWLTGTLSGANIYIPQAFTLREIIKFVLSVLGLTWQNIRAKLVRVIGETAVAALETGFDIVVTLVTQGPAAAWEKIRESLANLREMVMEQVMTFVRDRIVQAAITRLVTSLNPAGAFIQAIIAIYNTVMFLVERLRQIAQVVAAFIDSIAAIAAGQIGAAANRVEQTMAGLLTLVISFLARLVGLGRVSDAVIAIVDRIRAPIDRALDRVVEWIVNMARRVGRLVAGRAGGPGGAGPRGDIDRPVTLARERHTVRVHAQNGRLQVLMASNGFMAVEQEIAHVRRHFVETYLPAMDRGQEAEVLGRHMDSIVAEKTQWVTRYNAASSDAQKEVVLQAGLNVFVQRFQVVNQALETFIGPWATVRVGDSISYVEGGVPEYALVLEVMVRMGAAFGLNARPIDENPRGRKIPKKLRVSAQSADVVLGPMSRWMPYSRYGPPPGWQKFSGSVPMMPGSNDNPFLIDWPKPAWSAYPKLYFGSPRPQTTQATLRGLMGIDPTVSEFPPSGGTLGGQTIGIQPPYQLAKDSKVGPLSTLTTPGGGRLLTILRPYGFDTAADAMQVDHVQDIGFGGKDTLENLWPLAQTINSAAGGAMSNARATVPGTSATVAVRDLKRLTGTDFWFKLRSVR